MTAHFILRWTYLTCSELVDYLHFSEAERLQYAWEQSFKLVPYRWLEWPQIGRLGEVANDCFLAIQFAESGSG